MLSNFWVHIGPAAIHVHGGWVGVASGNRFCRRVSKTAKRALKDARAAE